MGSLYRVRPLLSYTPFLKRRTQIFSIATSSLHGSATSMTLRCSWSQCSSLNFISRSMSSINLPVELSSEPDADWSTSRSLVRRYMNTRLRKLVVWSSMFIRVWVIYWFKMILRMSSIVSIFFIPLSRRRFNRSSFCLHMNDRWQQN